MRWVLSVALALAISGCARYLERSLDSPRVDGGTVTFRVKSPSARTVQIAGDWPGNNWAEGDAEAGEILVGLMEKGEDGWQIALDLASGRYRYRFLVNETEWLLDPENPRIVDDGRGGKANLLIVP